jgi:hypothetical protein
MHKINQIDHGYIRSIIDDLRKAAILAQSEFEKGVLGYAESEFDTPDNAAWSIEVAFLKLLTATDFLELKSLNALITKDIKNAKSANTAEKGFAECKIGPEEPYSKWMGRFYQYLRAIEIIGGSDIEHSVTKDLKEILRATEYPITDTKLFGSVPKSEDDVHRRIEGVLRCVFPDLKHKPQITKQIKNFEPDTGLPDIQTLIEYKYISKATDVPIIADQILADTRGYHSLEWKYFVYVLYETNRFRPEREWNQMLRECGVPDNTTAIVLSGEPVAVKSDIPKPKKRARKV